MLVISSRYFLLLAFFYKYDFTSQATHYKKYHRRVSFKDLQCFPDADTIVTAYAWQTSPNKSYPMDEVLPVAGSI